MRLAVIGNLANVGYNLTRFLRQGGVDADFLMLGGDSGIIQNPACEDPGFWLNPPEWARPVLLWNGWPRKVLPQQNREFRRWVLVPLWRALRHYDAVIAITTLPIMAQFVGRPYLAIATGSDLRELAFQNSITGWLMRRSYRRARTTFFMNLDHALCVRRLGLEWARFLPFPLDTEKYAPAQAKTSDSDGLLLFHPTRLDWSYSGSVRRFLKGNDRFLRAFARWVHDGNRGRVILLDRGSDRLKTRELVNALGIADYIEFMPEMSKEELISHYHRADVVVDQFEIGSFGSTAVEAMSCGRPVLIYINPEYSRLCYDEPPPILNASSEEEIYNCLVRAAHPSTRIELGRQARGWILRHHDWHRVVGLVAHELERIV